MILPTLTKWKCGSNLTLGLQRIPGVAYILTSHLNSQTFNPRKNRRYERATLLCTIEDVVQGRGFGA